MAGGMRVIRYSARDIGNDVARVHFNVEREVYHAQTVRNTVGAFLGRVRDDER